MNEHPQTRDIDRLVGGELTHEELAGVLDRLDATPDGWKACTLAFVEAQAWHRAFDGLLRPPVATESRSPRRTRETSQVGRRAVSSHVALTALLVLVAFAGGMVATLAWRPASDDRIVTAGHPGGQRSELPPTKTAPTASQRPDQRRVLGVVNIASEGRTEVAFPLVAAGDEETVSIDLTAAELPDYNRQLLLRQGYRIEQHRKIVNVALIDGVRFRFPIDWVQVRYVGERLY